MSCSVANWERHCSREGRLFFNSFGRTHAQNLHSSYDGEISITFGGEALLPLSMADPPELDHYLGLLCCPRCHDPLEQCDQSVLCLGCQARYPLVDNVPILIAEERSVFRLSDFTSRGDTFFVKQSWLRRYLFGTAPDMNVNRVAQANYSNLADLLIQTNPRPRVLVVGGSVVGAGMEEFRARKDIEFIDTDVSFGPMTKVICDAHDLPIPSGSMDAAILQAVLEYVADPFRCMEEICRVLKPAGLVYAETPFLQPPHATPYDFHRFTFVGYRRLFRQFEQIAYGPVGGPGQALGNLHEKCAALSRGQPRRPCLRLPFRALDRFLAEVSEPVDEQEPSRHALRLGPLFPGPPLQSCAQRS